VRGKRLPTAAPTVNTRKKRSDRLDGILHPCAGADADPALVVCGDGDGDGDGDTSSYV
jgi:hypothetical protein